MAINITDLWYAVPCSLVNMRIVLQSRATVYPFRLFLLSVIIRWRKCLPVSYPTNIKFAIHRTIILSVLSYGCETWSLRLREEHSLRVYEIGYWGEYLGLRGTTLWGSGENYIMRSLTICRPHQNYLDDQIEKNGLVWACSTYGGGEEKAYKVFLRKPEGMRPLGRPRRRWEYNIKLELQEVGCGDMD